MPIKIKKTFIGHTKTRNAHNAQRYFTSKSKHTSMYSKITNVLNSKSSSHVYWHLKSGNNPTSWNANDWQWHASIT
jgi:hypothetical protein